MKALVYTATQETEIRDEAEPRPEEGQVVVELQFCGICGSDMHAWHGHDARRVPPLVLGHEAVGIALSGKYVGKRVAINPLMTCGTCKSCTSGAEHLCSKRELIGMRVPGAFAERVAVREENLFELPDHLSFENAALAEPLACAVHAVELAKGVGGFNVKGANVSVLGGGAIGLLCALVVLNDGASTIHVAETNALRRDLLATFDGLTPYDPLNCEGPEAESVDLVLDAVGSGHTRKASCELVRPGGVIVHVGLQDSNEGLDTRRITLQEISFLGSYCYRVTDFERALELLAQGVVTGSGWTEFRPLESGVQAFEDIHNGKAGPKIILETF